MAITKTVTLNSVTYFADTTTPVVESAYISVENRIVISDTDNPTDVHLPIMTSQILVFRKGDDVSQQDPKVQTIFNTFFS